MALDDAFHEPGGLIWFRSRNADEGSPKTRTESILVHSGKKVTSGWTVLRRQDRLVAHRAKLKFW